MTTYTISIAYEHQNKTDLIFSTLLKIFANDPNYFHDDFEIAFDEFTWIECDETHEIFDIRLLKALNKGLLRSTTVGIRYTLLNK
jgi:hypothetical protein